MNKAKQLLEHLVSLTQSVYASKDSAGNMFYYFYVENCSMEVKLESFSTNSVKFTIRQKSQEQSYCFDDYKDIKDSLNKLVENLYKFKNSYMLTDEDFNNVEPVLETIKKVLRNEDLGSNYKIKTFFSQNQETIEINDVNEKVTHTINIGRAKTDSDNEVNNLLHLVKVGIVVNDSMGIQERQYIDLLLPAYDLAKYPLLLSEHDDYINNIKNPLIHDTDISWIEAIYNDAVQNNTGLDKVISYIELSKQISSKKEAKNTVKNKI